MMTLTYRLEKGAPLSAEELDENFRDLHQRIARLERFYEEGIKVPGHAPTSTPLTSTTAEPAAESEVA